MNTVSYSSRCVAVSNTPRTTEDVISSKRYYRDLDEIEKEIIKYALPRDTINREDLVDELTDELPEDVVQKAFVSLCNENRLLRIGNSSEYTMTARRLF